MFLFVGGGSGSYPAFRSTRGNARRAYDWSVRSSVNQYPRKRYVRNAVSRLDVCTFQEFGYLTGEVVPDKHARKSRSDAARLAEPIHRWAISQYSRPGVT